MWLASVDQYSSAFDLWAASLGLTGEALLRLLLATLAGGLIGLERELRGREAGFRTNILVCVGSCLTMVVSLQFALRHWPHEQGVNINIDPARIAYGIMTGIGFLGAGTIIQQGGSIRGLTTAAAMWCVAAIGLAVGFGMYYIAFLAVVIVLMALWILGYFEGRVPKLRYRIMTIRRKWEVGCIAHTVADFKRAQFDVLDVSFERTPDLRYADISLKIAFTNKEQYFTFERHLEGDTQYHLLSAREL